MAKKAKRRGRPAGSKNKSTPAKAGKSADKMDIPQLRSYIGQLEATLAAKVQQQRETLESQLEGLQIYLNNKAGSAVRTIMRLPGPKSRKKLPAKYQSKKNKSLRWTGRGMMPVWMREEMKGTKRTKDDFLIK
jgi:DNA-binding protein H-NS